MRTGSYGHARAFRPALGALAALAIAAGVQSAAGLAPAAAAPAPAGGAPAWMHVISLRSGYERALRHVGLGRIAGITYRLGYHPKATASAAGAGCAEPDCPLAYHGGQVEHAVRIYLLLWGPTWATSPGEKASAAYLKGFYQALGVRPKDDWSTITSQYADPAGFPVFNGSQFAGVFTDTSTPPPGTTQAQFTAEANAFAASQNLTVNPQDDQVVIATQSGTCPAGFYAPGCSGGSGYYCAYHSDDPTSGVTFTNLPYLLDAGGGCGEDIIPNGSDSAYDGFSIVGGHEYAESITDPYPDTGWIDSSDSVSGGEIGDKCAWTYPGTAKLDIGLVTLSDGTYAMQPLFSNANLAAGRQSCPLAASPDRLTITSPGSQTTVHGTPVSLAVRATSPAGGRLAFSATGLPAGLSISPATGRITGTPTTIGSSAVTVRAFDTTGASASASFTWTVTACPPAQLLKNRGFETGKLAPWTGTRGVVTRSSRTYPARSGKWLALLRRGDTISQEVTIPGDCASAELSFWVKIISDAPARRVYSTLKAEIAGPGGTVLATLRTFNNRGRGRYRLFTFGLARYLGRTIVVTFLAHQVRPGYTTSFLIDQTALRVS